MASKIVVLMNAVPGPIAAWFRSDARIARMLRPLANRLVPAEPTPVVVRSGPGKGLRLLIDPRSEKYYWTGLHEEHVQGAVAGILKPGMSFWDVGAHIGLLTLIAARAVGASGQVHSFEPMPENRERLLASIKMNDFQNITVHDTALAAESGEAMLHAHQSSTMWTLIQERGEQKGIIVRCHTLDEVVQSIAPPHLIKVDVEGTEVDVLRGGQRLLQEHRPSLIVEFSNGELLAQAHKLLPFHRFDFLGGNHWLLR